MDNTNLKTTGQELKSQSGASRTPEQFKELCRSEYKLAYNDLVNEFTDRKEQLQLRMERKVEEYAFMNSIIQLNTLLMEGKPGIVQTMEVEKQIAALTYDTVSASYTLEYWRKEYGENMIVPVLCDIMNYFLQQFMVKEMLSDIQIMHLVLKLLASQPKLRLMELIFVLRKGLSGDYGPTYQRIGIDTLLGWFTKFYEDSASHLESKMTNGKTDEARGEVPWEIMERRLKAYQEEQRQKAEVSTKAWVTAKKHREAADQAERVTAYKEKVIKDGPDANTPTV